MKQGEKGTLYIELLIAITITALISGAVALATFQVSKGTERNNSYITAVRQVQNAGYWISRDSQMAQSIIADNLTPPDFLIMTWTEWNDPNNPVYHSVRYYFTDLTDGVGTLQRVHWNSDGLNEQTLVAQHIYYDFSDPDGTSQASYQSSVLMVQLASLFEETMENREYQILHRPNF